jgi:glutathione S-transferase
MAPTLTLHVLPPSHPCMTAAAALKLKGLEFEKVALSMPHTEEMERLYGPGRTTVPGLTIDGEERVHGSIAILERLERLVPDPPLYPEPIADAVHEAERWGDAELQDLGRRLPWGALHFRPEAVGTFAPPYEPLDPAGTDFAIRFGRSMWKYHRITAERLAEDLAGLPAKLEHVDELARNGIVGGEAPNAADLQIASTLRVLLTVGDLRPLMEGRAAEEIARRWFPRYRGEIPAGAYPAGWVPSR